MPQPDALSSSRQFSDENRAEEYPDFSPQQLSPITNPPPALLKDVSFSAQFVGSEISTMQTEQLSFPSRQIDISTRVTASISQEPHTEQQTPPASALNISATQSLVAALQATMKARQVVRQPVVIPGNKGHRREVWRATTRATAPEQHLSPRLRLFIPLGALFGVLLISLLALSPLSDSNTPLVKSLAGWTQAQQVTWSSFVAHVMGNGQSQSVTTPHTPAAPPIAVLSKSQYVAIAQQDAIAAGISPTYFTRQIMAESGFNPNAVSPSGAVGIAQFEPSTATGLGFNPNDPIAALKAAANYMARLSAQYGGDYNKALAAYNAGSGAVNSAVQRGGANWLSLLPAETQNYVARITGA